ncbi:MAG: lycopene cyclase [Myxococcales bacterium]|nr:lycopene cyclase [Myxococcales bacterium]
MRFDYLLVGGGLQSGLIALTLRALRPAATIAIVERDAALGGNHTWSFHESDLDDDGMREVVAPLIEHRWPGYEVIFPNLARSLALPYASFGSRRLDEVVRARLAAPGCQVITGSAATEVTADAVRLSDGRQLAGAVVIDARGPVAPTPGSAGYQKFVGLDLRLARPADLARPILMDATVPQLDGFRFFYVLPYAPDRLLVEDTRYADGPELDRSALREEVLDYARRRGFEVAEVLREESGVLPLPWRADPAPSGVGPLRAGCRGGFFHPATSYSLPVAARVARFVAGTAPDDLFGPAFSALVDEHRRQARFCHLLNWLLFRAAPAGGRWRIMSGFYRHPEALLRRFYALALAPGDRLRILRTGGLWYLAAVAWPDEVH